MEPALYLPPLPQGLGTVKRPTDGTREQTTSM